MLSSQNNIRATGLLAVLALVLVLPGCVSRDVSDLERYSQEVLARKGGRIAPLPEVKPYERYIYKSGKDGSRDPFASFMDLLVADKNTGPKIMSEAQKALAIEVFERNKEELEQYELDSLRMVGTLENDATLWGIVLDTGGVVHRVTVGNYLGRNNGKIIAIEENEIALREIINDSNGDLAERAASLALAED